MPNNRWSDINLTPRNVYLLTGGRTYDLITAYVEPNQIAEESGVRIKFQSTGRAEQVLLMRNTDDVRALIAALQKAIGPNGV